MPTIKSHDKKPLQKRNLKVAQTSHLGHLHQSVGTHPAKGLTPQGLNAILQRAEMGDWRSQFELFEDMEERWTHLFAEMDKLKRLVMALDWELHPPDNPSSEEEKLTERLKEAFSSMTDLEDLFFDMLDAVGKGFSPIEITWDYNGEWQLPATREKRPQSWFTHDRETRTKLLLRSNRTMVGEELLPYNWIVHRHQARSGYLCQTALYRSLVWVYLYHQYAARDNAEANEVFGRPIIVGKYPALAGDKEIETFVRAITGIGRNARGVIPQGMEIELLQAVSTSGNPFLATIAWAEKSASKAILYGTLTSQADGKTSTNALGDIHNEGFRDRIQSVALQLEASIKSQLIAPIVRLNIGQIPFNRLPVLKFDSAPKEDQDALIGRMVKAVSVGVPVPVSFVQQKLNIPEPVGQEPVLMPQFVAVAPASTTDSDKLAKGETEGNRDRQNKEAPSSGTGAPKKGAPAASMRALYDTFAATVPGATQALRARSVDPGPATPHTIRLAQEAAPAMSAMIGHLQALVTQADSLEALRMSLLEGFGDLPTDDFAAIMGMAMAAADLGGRAKLLDDAANLPANSANP